MDSTIYNKMEGEWVKAPPYLIKKLYRYEITREMFLLFAKTHNYKSVESAKVYMDLLDQWDDAANDLIPDANLFCILHLGLSLN